MRGFTQGAWVSDVAARGGVAAPTKDELVALLLGTSLSGEGAYAIARSLTDEVGPRLAGSAGDGRAVGWALGTLRAAGLKNVRAEPVKVPRWLRSAGANPNNDGAEIVAPAPQRLSLVALGGSIGTPGAAPLTAEVIEARSFEELASLGTSRVRGRLVLWNVVMAHGADGMAGYREVAKYRSLGAVEAARLGAVGSLVRSLGVASYRLPHTGAMRYQADVTKIPAAALAAEDAELLHRLLQRGPVRVRLQLSCQPAGEADSANVIGEVPGVGPQAGDIVLLGAHLDSWDLGTGAVDDAAGVAIAVTAGRALLQTPASRRTVRVVLFANEESGLRGATAYAKAHAAELPRHVAALEADSGAGRPLGFGMATSAAGLAMLRRLAAPLEGIGAAKIEEKEMGGADLSPLVGLVPILGMEQDTSRYFEWHHTAADTLDKIDRVELNLAAAAMAVMLRGLADGPDVLPRPSPQAAPKP